MNFNIREFLREIALSNAYQRSYDLPGGLIALARAGIAKKSSA